MKTEPIHTLILGAGPAGLAAGHTLAKAGAKPVVLEKDKEPGGLMRSIKRSGFIVDVGRKELYNRLDRVDRFWHELLGPDYRDYPHRGGILYQGKVIDMMPTFQGFRRGMPWGTFLNCAFDFGWARVKPGKSEPRNVEQYFYQKRGRGLTRVFAQGFQEKLTGKKWSEIAMPPEAVANGSDASLFATVSAIIERSFSKKEVNTFKGVWKHPAKGTGQICESIAHRMTENGGRFQFSAALKHISATGDRIETVVAESAGEMVTFKPQHVISSVPLELLIQWLVEKPAAAAAPADIAPPKRTVVLAYLFLDEEPRFPHAWLQVTCPSTRIGRITNYTAFNGDMVPKGKTALCCEYYCFGPDPLLELDSAAIAKMTLESCGKSGLVDPSKCRDHLVLKLPGADASQNRDNWMQASRLKQLEALNQFKNLYCVNRTELDIATLTGIEAGEAILSSNRTEFDDHVNPAKIGIRSEAKAFSFDLPAGVGR